MIKIGGITVEVKKNSVVLHNKKCADRLMKNIWVNCSIQTVVKPFREKTTYVNLNTGEKTTAMSVRGGRVSLKRFEDLNNILKEVE